MAADELNPTSAGRKQAIERGESKPSSLPLEAQNIPQALRERTQFVAWRWERRQDKKGDWKWTKPPLDAKITGGYAKSNDPKTWCDFEIAMNFYRLNRVDGIGFMFTAGDPFVGIDLDDCFDSRTGEIERWAARIISDMDSYTEISPSATGVKIIIRGQLPPGSNRRGPVEMYDRGRYFTLTGAHLQGTPRTINPRQQELEQLHRRLFGSKQRSAPAQVDSINLDDQEIIRRASEAHNGPKFRALWAGDTAGFESQSEADLALCGLLAFWCGGDTGRIDALFRQSGMMRPKWDRSAGEGVTYGQRTIRRCLKGRTEFYSGGRRCGTASRQDDKPQTGYEIILAYFRLHYQPIFRRGAVLYAATLSREVKAAEACYAAGIGLLDQLATAVDAPKKGDHVQRWRLPAFFNRYAKSAWVDLVNSVPEEEQSAEIHGRAEEHFVALVTTSLSMMLTLPWPPGEHAKPESRPLWQWCRLFARPGRWESIRGRCIWCRLDENSQLCIAVNAKLFSQIAFPELRGMTQRQFTDLCQLYNVGLPDRAGGERAVVLHHHRVDELFLEPTNHTDGVQNGEHS